MRKREISLKVLPITLFLTLAVSFPGFAEVSTTAGVNSSVTHVSTSTGANQDLSSDTISIQPSLGLYYNANRANLQFTANHQYLKRSDSSSSDDTIGANNRSNFTNYTYSGNLTLIENVLDLNARGAQSFRNVDIASALANDQIFGSQQLARTRRNSAGISFNTPNPDYLGLNLQANVSNVTSDRTTNISGELDSTNENYQARLFQGNEINNVSWDIIGSYAKSDGSVIQDVTSQSLDGRVYVGVYDKIRVVGTTRLEKNELRSIDVNETQTLEYNSAGIGLSWYKSGSQFIDLTLNQSSRQEGERDKFLSVKFNWRFSGRTSASGEFGRRFYGRSGRFTLEHNLRKLRSSITYEEDLTTFSRLVAGESVNGVFVCPIGEADFSQCFQPPSISYELQPGEEFTNLDFSLAEISEEGTLRKSMLVNTGYSFRKLRLSLTARKTNTEFLRSVRTQNSLNLSLNSSLKLNRRSSLSWNNSYSRIDRAVENNEFSGDDDITWSSVLSYNYSLSTNLSTQTNLQYTNRSSPVATRDFSSRRIGLTLKYKFD